jgi:hypothetical protein
MNEVTRLAPAQGFGDTLMKVLADPNISAEKLQIVLQEQRAILADLRKERFQAAFVAMSAEMPKVNKHGIVDLTTKDGRKFGSYKFARWEDMDEAIRPILQKFGFALTFSETPTANSNIQLRGELMHTDGHFISSERTMPPDRGPGRNDLQAQGSAISYAKRYLAEELCNIVRKGEDDDGRRAVPKPIAPDQVKELQTLLKAIKTQPDTFLRLFVTGCETLEDIQERDYPRLINALREKQRSMEQTK